MNLIYIDIGLHKEAPEIQMFREICDKHSIGFKAYGIEADPAYIDQLNALFSNDSRVQILNFAVANQDGTLKLFRSKAFDGEGSSIYASKNNVDENDFVEVPVLRMSEFLKDIESEDFIILKFNIEGAELDMMEDLISTKAFKKISLFCGSSPDIHKVSEIAELETDYLERLKSVGINVFKFHDHYNLEAKNQMMNHMEERILDLQNIFSSRTKPS